MKKISFVILLFGVLFLNVKTVKAQNENRLKLSGYLQTDQRLLLDSPNDWAWNENRLSLQLEKRISGNSKFYSEVWLRNMGIPSVVSSAGLYNKGIVDPWNMEIREAYVQINGLFTKNLDVTIGKQRIAWGTADKLNPTDNLNPYDFEDVLDFGRHRGSVAINMNYYINNDFSVQMVYIPVFQPDNMPVGVFVDALTPKFDLPPGMSLKGFSDNVTMPKFSFADGATAGAKFKGFVGGFDFSLSYVYGRDGIPVSTYNTFTPVDTLGGIDIHSDLSYYRTHIFGADMAGNIGGVGVWAEAAAFLPQNEVVMTNDFSALYPGSPVPVTQDSIILKKEAYLKFVVGADYTFSNGIYLNAQYLHGFVHERGAGNLDDYFFVQLEKKFFEDRLKIVPLAGGYVVSDWKDVGNNYSIIYAPSISYMATDNAEFTLSTDIFGGKGDNIFANFNDYNMIMFKLKYSF